MSDETREFLLEADGRLYQVLNDLFDNAYWGGHEDNTADCWECLSERDRLLMATNAQVREQVAEIFKAGFLKGMKYRNVVEAASETGIL